MSSESVSADLGGDTPDLVQRCREQGQAACQQLSEKLLWFRWDGVTGVNTMHNWCY